MKNMIAALMLASCAWPGVHAEPNAAVFAFPSVRDGTAWNISHADGANLQFDGRSVVHLVAAGDSAQGVVGLALPRALTFSTGTIDIDLKGKNIRQRSFVGVAFNVVDEKTFESIYFRPFNFRAAEPMRSRAVQYIAWPAHPWEKLRTNTPGQFEHAIEAPPDPEDWFHAQIEVTDEQVKVFVDHAKEASLTVQRLSSGGAMRPVGLFVDSSDGYYANLTVTPSTKANK